MKAFFLSNFNPHALFSWPVFALSLGWAFITNFTDVDNNPPGNYALRIASVALAHLALFATIGVFSAFARVVPRIVGAIAFVPALVIACLVRGWVVFTLLNAIDHDSADLLGYRLMGSVTNVGMSILATAVVVHRVRTYRESRLALLTERIRLVEVRDHARGRLQTMAQKTVDDVRAAIVAALDLGKSSSAEATAERIRNTIDEIVRPLSHRLEREQFAWEPSERGARAETFNWRDVIKNALSARHLYPREIGLAITAVALSTTLRHQAPLEALYVLSCALVGTWSGLLLVRRFVATRRSAWARRTSVIAGAVLAGVVTGLSTLPVKLDTERPFSLVVQAPLFTLLFTVLFALAGSATRQAARATARLAETTSELAWEVARISEEYRHAKLSLARALHGKIQAGMMSSLMRLRQAIKDNDPNLDAISEHTREELASLVGSLGSSGSAQEVSLDSVIEDIQETWEDIAACELAIDSETTTLVISDPIAITALAELLPELAFNAIKHGEASIVSLEIELHDNRTIRLVCIDNGSRPADSGRVGLGTKLLDQCALRWRRTTESTGTITEVFLPFSQAV